MEAGNTRQRVCITLQPSWFDTVVDPATEATDADVIPISWGALLKHVRQLPAPERQVITWRYGLDGLTLTVREVAPRLGVSPATVVRIEQRALRKLRLRGLPTSRAAA